MYGDRAERAEVCSSQLGWNSLVSAPPISICAHQRVCVLVMCKGLLQSVFYLAVPRSVECLLPKKEKAVSLEKIFKECLFSGTLQKLVFSTC